MRIIKLLQESRFGGGRGSDAGRSVFASKELPVEQFEEEKKEDNENEPEPVPNRFAQPKGQDTDYDKRNQEQEDKFNDFMKGATTDDSKRFGLIVIDKEGNILQTNLRGPALENKLAEIFGH